MIALSIAQLLWGLILAAVLLGIGYVVVDYRRWSKHYDDTH